MRRVPPYPQVEGSSAYLLYGGYLRFASPWEDHVMSTTDTSTTTQRAMRADARQNYEKLVKAATDAFAEHGSDAALDDIARRAGVGIGTLYRHFPTRQELIEATFCDQMDTLVAQAEELLKHPNPAEAFDIWLHALLTQSRVCRCLAASVTIACSTKTPQCRQQARRKARQQQPCWNALSRRGSCAPISLAPMSGDSYMASR